VLQRDVLTRATPAVFDGVRVVGQHRTDHVATDWARPLARVARQLSDELVPVVAFDVALLAVLDPRGVHHVVTRHAPVVDGGLGDVALVRPALGQRQRAVDAPDRLRERVPRVARRLEGLVVLQSTPESTPKRSVRGSVVFGQWCAHLATTHRARQDARVASDETTVTLIPRVARHVARLSMEQRLGAVDRPVHDRGDLARLWFAHILAQRPQTARERSRQHVAVVARGLARLAMLESGWACADVVERAVGLYHTVLRSARELRQSAVVASEGRVVGRRLIPVVAGGRARLAVLQCGWTFAH